MWVGFLGKWYCCCRWYRWWGKWRGNLDEDLVGFNELVVLGKCKDLV